MGNAESSGNESSSVVESYCYTAGYVAGKDGGNYEPGSKEHFIDGANVSMCAATGHLDSYANGISDGHPLIGKGVSAGDVSNGDGYPSSTITESEMSYFRKTGKIPHSIFSNICKDCPLDSLDRCTLGTECPLWKSPILLNIPRNYQKIKKCMGYNSIVLVYRHLPHNSSLISHFRSALE